MLRRHKNTGFRLLWIIALISIAVLFLLVRFEKVHIFEVTRYFILSFSLFLTGVSLAIYWTYRTIDSRWNFAIFLFLIFPFILLLFGTFFSDYIENLGNWVIGGSIFQIGTSIYFLIHRGLGESASLAFQVLEKVAYRFLILFAILVAGDFSYFSKKEVVLVVGVIYTLINLVAITLKFIFASSNSGK